MKKKVILILIQIFVVAIALALTVTTYAWFVSQTRVTVTQTTVTAAAGANTVIDSEEEFTYTPYQGETGQGYPSDQFGGVDSPYTVEKKLTVSFSPLGNDSVMSAKILSMDITRVTGEHVTSEGEDGTPEILDFFTCRVEIDGYEYAPDENGLLYREIETEDGEGTETVYYEVPEATSAELTFKLIFSDETSYAHWEKGEYGSIEPFAYCGMENMRAVFACRFEIGIAARIVESGGED